MLDPNGLTTRTTRRTVSLPAALRYRCGIHLGDQLLLTAVPTHHLVIIHPIHTLNTMLLHHHTNPTNPPPETTMTTPDTAGPHHTDHPTADTPVRPELHAAQLLLDRLGIIPADLLTSAKPNPNPTATPPP